jgi:biotin carboxyl carrier protein
MRYEVEIDGQQMSVEINCERDLCLASINGRAIEFEVSEPEPGAYLLFIDDRVLEIRMIGHPGDPTLVAMYRGQRIPLRMSDPRQRRRAALTLTGKVQLTATMPGRVVRCLCQPGESVNEGQGVIVLEAMKMQNEVRSPKTGTVTEVMVEPGQTVEAGTVLAVIE